MQIPFDNITKDRCFNIQQQTLNFSGNLYQHPPFVRIKAVLNGQIDMVCFRCNRSFLQSINEYIEGFISNGMYSGSDKEVIYEAIDGNIDIEEILLSEITIYQSTYTSCVSCQTEINNIL